MNAIVKKLKLYRIITVANIFPRFWGKSKKIAREYNLSTFPIFWDMMRSLIKFGASDENYEQLHFWEHDDEYKNSFITWRRNMAIMYKFCTPASKDLFLDKVVWNKRFAKYVKRGWIYCKESDLDSIRSFLMAHSDVVVKRIDGACGVGVDKYKAADFLSDSEKLQSLVGADSILEEAAVNIEALRKFSPSSFNTLRLVTCIDSYGVPKIIAAAFRMGNGISHTDNIVTGGIACYVDLDSGKIVTDGLNVEGKFFEYHPYSHLKFKGFTIPCWKEARSLALELALEVPEARFVGWDIVLSEKGMDVLEGNIPPGEELTELDMNGKYHKVMAMY